ncbi:hypothetical protein D3C72_1520400 [compost metagenome]
MLEHQQHTDRHRYQQAVQHPEHQDRAHRADHQQPVTAPDEVAPQRLQTQAAPQRMNDDGGEDRFRCQGNVRQDRQHNNQYHQRRHDACQARSCTGRFVRRCRRIPRPRRHPVEQAGQQVGRAEGQQVAVRLDAITMLERVGTDRTIRLRVQDHHHRERQFTQSQPVGKRQHRQSWHLKAQIDHTDQLHTVSRQVQPLARRNANHHHQQPARQTPKPPKQP